jgi:hypothetical protein
MTATAPRGAHQGRLPDFFLIGVPKAGTTALHSALAEHPQLFLSKVKEPKYYMCGDSPPPAYKGPGDAHSSREWIWQRSRYQRLFRNAPDRALCGESTPFYLYNRDARRRLAADVPHARLVVVLRDPVDRLYSNWMHLWVDGLEPCADVVEACAREERRINAGWAPFWHYRSLGMYGRQLADLYDHFPAEQVLLVRYRELVDSPGETIDRVCRFLGISEEEVPMVPADNSRPFVEPGARTRAVGSLVRWGARAGALFPPELWRAASRPLVGVLQHRGRSSRPTLSASQRAELLEPFLPDIDRLEELTGQSFDDWRGHRNGDTFRTRSAS